MLSPTNRLTRRITLLVILFVAFGLIVLFSASALLGLHRHQDEFYFLSRQASAAAVGILVMLILSKVRYQFLEKIAVPLMIFQVILTGITLIDAVSHEVQGVSRWIQIGGFTFQPSELAKITLAVYMAKFIFLRKMADLPLKKTILMFIPVPILLYLIFRQPDLGSVVLLSSVILGMLFISGARPVYLLGTIGIGAGMFFVATLNSDYRRRRLAAFLNPWADPQGNGFQSIQSFISFHSGHLAGLGLGNGNSKLFHLPEVHTDFIFAMVGEELGFVGACLLILAYAYLGFLLFKIVRFAPDAFGRYLAFGLALSLMLQVIVNIGGVTGLIPVKGLPLPFLSWGRSSLVINLMMVGILLNIAKQSFIMKPAGGKRSTIETGPRESIRVLGSMPQNA